MSRRAKRIILAVFLVLTAIPVVYFVLSWRPEDPLRFQACAYRPNSEIQPPGTMGSRGTVEILIENTSSFPICYYMGYLQRDADPSSPSVLLRSADLSSNYAVTIPPGKFIRAKSDDWNPRDQRDGGIHSPGISVRYFWLSSTRARWDRLLGWWYSKRNPSSLRFPNWHESRAPLIPPPDSASMP